MTSVDQGTLCFAVEQEPGRGEVCADTEYRDNPVPRGQFGGDKMHSVVLVRPLYGRDFSVARAGPS